MAEGGGVSVANGGGIFMAEGGSVSFANGGVSVSVADGGVGVANGDGGACVANGGGCLGSGRSSPDPVSKGHDHDEEECADLEPFFFDEAEAIADNERRMQREQEEARKLELRILAANVNKAVRDKIRDDDPKQGGAYYNRFFLADFSTFDIDEESPLEPMRYTDRVYKKDEPRWPLLAVDFLSVKIVSLDVDFPIHVYGTVIARDSLDCKCIYLFQRDEDNCQLINSECESLILTGPKRGLVLVGDAYVETDLKIKDHQRHEVKELSKGVFGIPGIAGRQLDKCKIESKLLATRLSTVEVMYAVVKDAVEATIAIEVLQGDFYGKITACTSSIQSSIVLHDSEVSGVMTCDGKRVIQLLRRVVAVCLKEKLNVTVVAQTGDVECKNTVDFTPSLCGRGKGEITVGATKMLVEVTWSVLDT
ncbi:hypothetical protein QOZ80_2AG0135520 [Eleusine coracana subsp. coracana]|nr:hypothetical protein QOZ80_2AG0135520 [Eleusine coracana subsp. coracana]